MGEGRTAGLFVPGWGAPGSLYTPGLPAGWSSLDPPLRRARDLDGLRRWLVRELESAPGPAALAGHSMGGALALLAAVTVPERISSLVLFAPAGLPLTKPLRDSARDCGAQLRRGLYRRADVLNGLKQFARAPAAAVRLAAAVRSLELTAELEIVRGHGIPVKVVSCTTDTLVTVGHCRRIAELLAAAHRELPLAGGHMWMLRDWPAFSAELE